MSTYRIVEAGSSNSFPDAHSFLDGASPDGAGLVILGTDAGAAFAMVRERAKLDFVAIELGTECLGAHTGESFDGTTSNVLGFSRFRLGNSKPSNLVEIVKQQNTSPTAVAAVQTAFKSANLVTAICNDFPGRIVNRLIRPFYNAVLRRLDEGLASAEDLDKTLCLGLGYPEGPLSLLQRTGLDHHYEVTDRLYAALGQEAYSPARRAQVAIAIKRRR
jgi:3-hydroxybutyryl-CoA dehydrogenase